MKTSGWNTKINYLQILKSNNKWTGGTLKLEEWPIQSGEFLVCFSLVILWPWSENRPNGRTVWQAQVAKTQTRRLRKWACVSQRARDLCFPFCSYSQVNSSHRTVFITMAEQWRCSHLKHWVKNPSLQREELGKGPLLCLQSEGCHSQLRFQSKTTWIQRVRMWLILKEKARCYCYQEKTHKPLKQLL